MFIEQIYDIKLLQLQSHHSGSITNACPAPGLPLLGLLLHLLPDLVDAHPQDGQAHAQEDHDHVEIVPGGEHQLVDVDRKQTKDS